MNKTVEHTLLEQPKRFPHRFINQTQVWPHRTWDCEGILHTSTQDAQGSQKQSDETASTRQVHDQHLINTVHGDFQNSISFLETTLPYLDDKVGATRNRPPYVIILYKHQEAQNVVLSKKKKKKNCKDCVTNAQIFISLLCSYQLSYRLWTVLSTLT